LTIRLDARRHVWARVAELKDAWRTRVRAIWAGAAVPVSEVAGNGVAIAVDA
jgi:hypothetical protein